jgi:methylglutamate dehydrogenase subunit D
MFEPRFPLDGLAGSDAQALVGAAAGVTLAVRRPGSICEIGAWPDTMAGLSARLHEALGIKSLPPVGRIATAPGLFVLRLAPGRFQIIGQRTGLSQTVAGEVPVEEGAVIDLSQGREGLRISGPRAGDALQKGVSFDLGLGAFPAQSVAQTGIHHMPVTLLRLDDDTFDAFVLRGFAVSFWQWLAGAAAEYGWQGAAPVA